MNAQPIPAHPVALTAEAATAMEQRKHQEARRGDHSAALVQRLRVADRS